MEWARWIDASAVGRLTSSRERSLPLTTYPVLVAPGRTTRTASASHGVGPLDRCQRGRSVDLLAGAVAPAYDVPGARRAGRDDPGSPDGWPRGRAAGIDRCLRGCGRLTSLRERSLPLNKYPVLDAPVRTTLTASASHGVGALDRCQRGRSVDLLAGAVAPADDVPGARRAGKVGNAPRGRVAGRSGRKPRAAERRRRGRARARRGRRRRPAGPWRWPAAEARRGRRTTLAAATAGQQVGPWASSDASAVGRLASSRERSLPLNARFCRMAGRVPPSSPE